ncbi:hypothetical protein CspeluHIS016_0505240 [Cutaneotrichosporon spelunceum]|uniref:P-loop containing nucleoside triphosphate hydrolase protein n=1 Tax=Cutaneotrichosporon spelunceum TaxID=1672016 RepID=A0AAD3YE07_9TREE|nr:hypothetical protein CspeluHIS016_0505240 [Cutaneotrichosporon spelunceum]
MPRIRKKTSNRQATRDRAKITKKVAEHKKKAKRASKRNPTWKSKKKADPGVPNSFHLKDQVLAEMADEKRRSAEAKIAAKDAARRARAGEASDDGDAPGISSFMSSVLPREALTGVAPLPVEEDDDVPDLLDSDLPTLQAALDAAHILLEVVDARDIQGGRSAHVEKLVTDSESQVWLVVNKADLVPREALEGWLKALDLPAYVVSATEGWGFKELLAGLNAAANKNDDFKVALLGLPNVGKSAVANALLGADMFKVRPGTLASSSKHPAPTTAACAEAELPGGIRVIDTPGWEYVEEEESDDEDDDEDDEDEEGDVEMDDDEDEEDEEKAAAMAAKWDALEARVAGDLLRRNLGRVDKVKDVFPLVNYVFARSNPQDLMLKYNVPYFPAGDLQSFLTGLARVNGRVKTRGDPDHDGAARIVLRDWSQSSFPYYTVPPKGAVSTIEQVDNSSVLSQLKTRKEMRASGLVKFQASEVDDREIFLDDDYTAVGGPDSDDEDEDGEGFTDADFAGFDGEEEGGSDDEDEDDEDEGASFVGSDEGEELELESGPEPSSPSSLEGDELPSDDDDDEESEQEAPAPSRKRKAPAVSVDVRKKAKTVSFNAKPEPKSAKREVREVKSILKAKDKAAEKPAKKAKVSVPKDKTSTKANGTTKPKPAITTKSKAVSAATDAGFEAYDFSKHF